MGVFKDEKNFEKIKVKNRPRGRPPKVTIIEKPTMDYVKKVNNLVLEGNISQNWKKFYQAYEIFEVAAGIIEKDEKVRIVTFLNAVGDEALELYNSFNLSEDKKKKYSEIVAAFEAFCKPKKNVVYERFLFFSRQQNGGEPFDNFLRDIKKLVRTCEFGDQETSLLRDRVILGMADKNLQEKLLQTENLTFDKAVEMCRTSETAKEQARTLQGDPVINEVTSQFQKMTYQHYIPQNEERHKTERKGEQRRVIVYKCRKNEKRNKQFQNKKQANQFNSNFRYNSNKKINCERCRQHHDMKCCPAMGKKCSYCNQYNHFAVACRNKKVKQITY